MSEVARTLALIATLGGALPPALAAAPERTVVTAVLTLVPERVSADEQLAKGCWVRFYDHADFQGDRLILIGPLELPTMQRAGPPWRDWDSVVVGAAARATVYDNERFRDRSATFRAGERVADLGDAELGWFEDIQSLKVACTVR